MRRVAVVLALLLSHAALAAGETTAVLVGTTATQVPGTSLSSRKVLTIQNLNPQPIYCCYQQAKCVLGEAYMLSYKDTFTTSTNVTASFTVWCISAVAQTLTTGPTIAMELQ